MQAYHRSLQLSQILESYRLTMKPVAAFLLNTGLDLCQLLSAIYSIFVHAFIYLFLSNQIFLVYYRLHKAFPDTLKYRIQSSVLQLFFERLSTFCYKGRSAFQSFQDIVQLFEVAVKKCFYKIIEPGWLNMNFPKGNVLQHPG